jgi:2-polyprenyl-6-methoxyphenol hydroxylase-like FAD-dependent oxidoreductase
MRESAPDRFGPDPSGGPVLVVGAGPAGLVTAGELARHGVLTRVVDSGTEPRFDSGAVEIGPRSQHVLAAWGVLDRIRTRALPQRGIEVAGRSGLDRSTCPMLHLAQPETERVLADRVGEFGVVVERGVTLTGLVPDSGGVDVTLRTGDRLESARFEWVIGADGSRSAVRGLVGSGLRGPFPAIHFLVGDATIVSANPRDVTRLVIDADGIAVVKHLPDGLSRLMVQIPDPGPRTGLPDPDALGRLGFEWTGVRVVELRWCRFHSVQLGQVPRYRVGRVLLVGDAAHVQNPAGGQGLDPAVADAENLAGKLALVVRERAAEQLMDSYHDERHPGGEDVVRWAAVLTDRQGAAGIL